MKNKKNFWFTSLIVVLTVVISVLASQITGRIVISQNSQRIYLVNSLQQYLEQNAVLRLRSLDSQAQWLNVEEDAPQEVQDYIAETLTTSIRLSDDQLSKDSNLAWIIHMRVDGVDHEYTHNWKDSYNMETGALDYTIRKSGNKISYSGLNYPTQAFNAKKTILVPPSIVPTKRLGSQKGAEYSYSFNLPNDFSIRYYIPSNIKPNAGVIARTCENMDVRNFFFALFAGSGVLAAIVILTKWKYEEETFMLAHLRNMKAIFAWLTMGISIYGVASILYALAVFKASGTLNQLLQSFGLTITQAEVTAFGTILVGWMVLYQLITLALLYIKSIFSQGIVRYLQHDTLVAQILKNSQVNLAQVMSSSTNNTSIFQIFVLGSILMVIVCALIAGFGMVFGSIGLIIGFVFGVLLCCGFLWGVYSKMDQSYQKVYQASQKLANGHFNDLEEQEIGLYQPLYNLLVETSNSCQEAVKEGLASQISKTQLISNVSHDLKTPVAGIQSYAELISLSDNMDDIHEYSKRLTGYSERLTDLITDLFDVARAMSGDIVLEQIDLDLSELIMQVAAEWTDQFDEKQLTLVMNLQPNALVHLDPGKTVRIIENLLSNIYKYAMKNTRVFVDLYEREGFCHVIFKNISSTQMNFTPESIVERFTRGDASRHEKGSGLGLAIVKSFTEIQQGSFEVQTDGDLFKAVMIFEAPLMAKMAKEAREKEFANRPESMPDLPPMPPLEEPLSDTSNVDPIQVNESIMTKDEPLLEHEEASSSNAKDNDVIQEMINENAESLPVEKISEQDQQSQENTEEIPALPVVDVEAIIQAICDLHQRKVQQQQEYEVETDVLRKASLKSSITELERMEKEAIAQAKQDIEPKSDLQSDESIDLQEWTKWKTFIKEIEEEQEN